VSRAAKDGERVTPSSKNDGARVEWLRERLIMLASDLGRAPTTVELSRFLNRHGVQLSEIDWLAASSVANPARTDRATSARTPRDIPIPRETQCMTSSAPSPAQLPEQRSTPVSPPSTDAEGPAPHGDHVVRRAVDDLVDDWHRAGGVLQFDDVTRLASKRSLSVEQLSAVIADLRNSGVEIEGLTPAATDVTEDEDKQDLAQWESTLPEQSSDVVRDYLRAIAVYPLLTAEDEVRLGRQIHAGLGADKVLRDEHRRSTLPVAQQSALVGASRAGRRAHSELVCANLRLVVSIAKHRSFHGSGVEFIDRIQDGNTGLMHAADKFDHAMGFKFSTYATWWIRQAISRGIADRGRLIRIPVHMHEKLQQVRRTERELAHTLDRSPTSADIAERLSWDAATVQAVLDCFHPVVSFDVLVGVEGDTTLGDLLSDQADVDGRTDPVNCVITSACVRDIDTMLATLDRRSAEIIRRRYGLNGDEETLETIGERFGVTRERIRQLEMKAMKQLRNPHISSRLRSYLVEDAAEESTPAVHGLAGHARPLDQTSSGVSGTTNVRNPATTTCPVGQQQFLFETVADVVDAS
jgi:RNA polymerase primary sigma factor